MNDKTGYFVLFDKGFKRYVERAATTHFELDVYTDDFNLAQVFEDKHANFYEAYFPDELKIIPLPMDRVLRIRGAAQLGI